MLITTDYDLLSNGYTQILYALIGYVISKNKKRTVTFSHVLNINYGIVHLGNNWKIKILHTINKTKVTDIIHVDERYSLLLNLNAISTNIIPTDGGMSHTMDNISLACYL